MFCSKSNKKQKKEIYSGLREIEHKPNKKEKGQSSTDSFGLTYYTEISLNHVKHQCPLQKPSQS